MEQKLRFGLVLGRLAVLEKIIGPDYKQLLRSFFSCFQEKKKFAPQTIKKMPSKVANIRNRLDSFLYCQPAQNQPKSQSLFHKNCSSRNLCIMTLADAALKS